MHKLRTCLHLRRFRLVDVDGPRSRGLEGQENPYASQASYPNLKGQLSVVP